MTMKTTFDDAVCPTPGPSGNHAGSSGGADIAGVGPGGQGLVGNQFSDAICPPMGGKETSSSELGTTPYLTDVKDAPAGQPSGMSSTELIKDHAEGDATFTTPK